MNAQLPPTMYPTDAFPKIVREAIQEVQRSIQAPDALIGMSFLSTMSAAAQGLIKVKLPTTGKLRPISLYLFSIAESGERKSTVDNLVSSPIHKFDESSEAQFNEAIKCYTADYNIWSGIKTELTKRTIKENLDGEVSEDWKTRLAEHERQKPVKPHLRRIILQDTSERALLEALEGQGESVALISDEGEIILSSPLLNRLGAINKLWDGGPLVLDRVHGKRVSVRDARVTVSVMAQSAVVREYLRKQGSTSRGSGFFARFLVAWPQSTQGYRFSANHDVTWDHLSKFHALIESVLLDAGHNQPPTESRQAIYELDEDAKDLFFKAINSVEMQIQPCQALSDIPDFASKTGEIALRIAALFHHFSGQSGKISIDTLNRAISIVNYHIGEFKRIFSPTYEVPQIDVDIANLHDYICRKTPLWPNGVIPRNYIYRSGPIRNYARFQTAIDALCFQGKTFAFTYPPSKTRYISINLQPLANFSPQQLAPNPLTNIVRHDL